MSFAIILAVAKGSGLFSAAMGQPAVLGELLAGVILGPSVITDGYRLIDERSRALAYGFFVPIFFVGVGLAANARDIHGSDAVLLVVICLVAGASKILGCGLGALLGGESLGSSLQIGTGMISRGEVGLIVATVGLSKGLIGTDVYSIIVEEVVTAWHDNGAAELTIMDGVGTRLPWEQLHRDDLPLLP